MLLKLSLLDVMQVMTNATGLGLQHIGQQGNVVVWSVGNCLFVARGETSQRTDFVWDNYRSTPPDDDAQAAWNTLHARWTHLEATDAHAYMLSVETDDARTEVADAKCDDVLTPLEAAARWLGFASAVKSGPVEDSTHPETPRVLQTINALPPVSVMKKHYADYSARTAEEIVGKLPEAYQAYENGNSSTWGPGVIAKIVGLGATTVGRYLKAFRAAGITEWGKIPLP